MILNPNAGSGRAGRIWERIQPLMVTTLGEIEVAITQNIQDVHGAVAKAHGAGIRQVIAIGGDGTSNVVINALLNLPTTEKFTFGQIPLGTGQDFARTMRIPGTPEVAVQWLAAAQPSPMDVGYLEYDGQARYFLNIASAGVSGEVDQKVNQIKKRRPWSFLSAAVQGFLQYSPALVRVKLDGQDWHEGKAWILAVANGTTFGAGMKIAPHAKVDDGLLDVVLLKDASRLKVISDLASVYPGRHLNNPNIIHRQAKMIEVEALDAALPLDIDGETGSGKHLRFMIKPAAINFMAGKG